jgi:hypothetical protein
MAMLITEFLKTVFLVLIYTSTGYLILFFKGSFKRLPINFRVIFLSLFTGLVFLVSLYSIWFTHGKTVLIVLLPLVGFLAIAVRQHDQLFVKNEYPKYLASAIILFFAFVFFTISYFAFYNEIRGINIDDYILYSRISYYLPITGCENDYHFFNTLDNDYRAVTPYHYFELWLNSINCSILPSSSIYETIMLVTPTIFLLAVFLGFLAIYETYKKVDAFCLLLSFSILFFNGIVFRMIPMISKQEYLFYPFSLYFMTKFAPTMLFAIASYLFLTNLSMLSAVLTLAMLAVISIVNLPSIGFAFVVVFLLFKLSKSTPHRDFSLKVLAFALLPLLFVIGFYLVFGNRLVVRGGTTGSAILQQIREFISPEHVSEEANIIFTSFIRFVVFYLLFFPIALIVLFKEKVQRSNNIFYFIIVLSFCAGGALSTSLLSQKLNSFELFQSPIKVMQILIFISLILLDKPIIKYSALCIILLISASNMKSRIKTSFEDQGQKINTKAYNFAVKHMDMESITAFIKDSSDYKNSYNYYSTCFCIGNYIGMKCDPFFSVNISDYNLPVVKDSLNIEGIRMGIFFRFVEKQKQADSFVSIAQSQIDFIKKYHVKNILLSPKATLPPSLMVLIDSSMAVVPEFGDKIVRLRY